MNKIILSLVVASVSGLTLVSCETPPPPPPVVEVHHYHTTTPKPSNKPEDFKAITPPHSYSQ